MWTQDGFHGHNKCISTVTHNLISRFTWTVAATSSRFVYRISAAQLHRTVDKRKEVKNGSRQISLIWISNYYLPKNSSVDGDNNTPPPPILVLHCTFTRLQLLRDLHSAFHLCKQQTSTYTYKLVPCISGRCIVCPVLRRTAVRYGDTTRHTSLVKGGAGKHTLWYHTMYFSRKYERSVFRVTPPRRSPTWLHVVHRCSFTLHCYLTF